MSWRDGVFFSLGLCFTALVLVDGVEQHAPTGQLVVEGVLGGVGSLGLWVRRRWPVGFAVVAGLLSVFSVAASGVALIALFTVAVHRPIVVVALVVAGHTLASLVSLWVRPDVAITHWSQAVLGVVCVAAMLAWGMYVRARRQSQRDRARRVESETERLVARARHLERDRIAREMHDVLAHRLSLVSLHAGALELRLGDGADARAAGVVRDSAHQALEDLREVLGVLRADDIPPDRPQPTLADLPALVGESQHAGSRIVLDSQVTEPGAAPAVVSRSAYRIVQEGLTNARKHAHGSRVSVSVRGAAGAGLTVEIRNPWPAGAAGIPGAGAGLIGLTERATLAGGRLEHGRTESGDFRLWAWLPWPA
jgi:signal transduction histidine kinase